MLKQFDNIYRDKTVLVTGHTGFKGSWLAIYLLELGAKVIGYALDPFSEKDNFVLAKLSEKIVDVRGDIRDRKKLEEVFKTHQPDFVFHLAAQPLVRLSYDIPVETYEVNVMGTINVMECIRKTATTKVGVLITTDKCYENKEQFWGYRENEALGGYDPYSSSKGAAEVAIQSWQRSFFHPDKHAEHGKAVTSVRAGNVIGGGDWALDRIIPDCIRALESNQPIEIRSPQAIRPWEHVLEPLSGYLLLGAKMWEEPTVYAEPFNFGPNYDSIITVWEMAEKVVELYGEGSLKDGSDPNAVHEAKLLALDVAKARFKLGWIPTLGINDNLALTVDWYKRYQKEEVYDLCVEQIKTFVTR